jgi:hypothetical protein
MAHSHYVMDLYFRADERSDRLRREVLRIEATSDDEAQAEGRRVDGWRKTHHYEIRAIQTPARAAHKLIYSSPVEEVAAPVEEVAVPVEAPIVASEGEPSPSPQPS